MTTLMVTPFAPYRDGIAAYAVQELRALNGQGVDVEVMSPLPSAAHHHLSLGGVRGIGALAARARRYERIIIQFSPEMMFGACHGPIERVMVWAGLSAIGKLTKLELRVHEIEHGPLKRNWAEKQAAARAIRSADVVSVHTEVERDDLARLVGVAPSQITIVGHGVDFVASTTATRDQARSELGLGSNHVFLCIGFVQEHKGFDRAVAGFGAAGLGANAELHIVGSVRVDDPELISYASFLDRLCEQTPGANFSRRYVSDELFDRWILAADTVVLPYRDIWSSGVLERANLLGTPVLAANVGGLGYQISDTSMLFDNDSELASLMAQRVNQAHDTVDSGVETIDLRGTNGVGWGDGHDDLRQSVQSRIRQEAARQTGGSQSKSQMAGIVVDPIVKVGRFERPHPVSERTGVGLVKKFVGRAVGWEIDALVRHVNELQTATLEAVSAAVAERNEKVDP